MSRISIVVLALAMLGSGGVTGDETASSRPTYMGRAFLFEIDFERGRELGWSESDASREQIHVRVAEALESRLRRSGKFVEAVVSAEGEDRLSVVFVGPQWRAFEELIQQGLSAAGRIAFEAMASAEELAACGEGAFERPECAALAARSWRSPGDGDEAVLVRADRLHLLQPRTAERLEIVALTTGSRALQIHLSDEAWDELASFLERIGDRQLALTLDGEVLEAGIPPASVERPLLIDGDFTLEELRPVVFAFAGEPLPAPVRFLGAVERKLPNVKHRDSPTAID